MLLCAWDSPDKNNGVGFHALLQRIFLTQGLSPCLLHLLHWQVGSLPLVPPGKPQGEAPPPPPKSLQLCPTLCDPTDCSPPGSSVPGDSSGKNTGMGCHTLLQGIFLTQGSNPCLLYFLHWQVGSLPLVPPGKPDKPYIWI